MATLRRFDYILGGKGFMLVRTDSKARSWTRTGLVDTPSRRSDNDAKYGQLPDQVEHAEVWDDWSDGFGHAYRRTGENTYHWAENFDARFPRQLVHCQNARLLASTAVTLNGARIDMEGQVESSFNVNADSVFDAGTLGVIYSGSKFIPAHLRSIFLLGKGWWGEYVPQDPTVSGYDFVQKIGHVEGTTGGLYAGVGTNYGGRAAITASYLAMPNMTGSFCTFLGRGDGVMLYGQEQYACGFAMAGNQIWKAEPPAGRSADNAIFLRNCAAQADPTFTANWGATFRVGESGGPILDLTSIENQVAVSTERGLFVGDETGTFINVLADAAMAPHPENGRDLCAWNGTIIYPHIGGLWQYDPQSLTSNIRDITPIGVNSNRSPITGRFRCVRGYGPWLLGGFFTGSQSHLLAGYEQPSGTVWHTLNRLPGRCQIGRIHVDGAVYASNGAQLPPRIWMTTEGSRPWPTAVAEYSLPLVDHDWTMTGVVYWMPIPPGFGNPLGSPIGFSANYVGSARMELGITDFGAPTTKKVYRCVELTADNLASGAQWCKLYYTVDNEATRHLLGTSAVSPKDTLYFHNPGKTPDTAASFISGYNIQLSLESYTASPNITPIFHSVVLRGSLRPKSVDQITALTRIGDNVRDRQSAPMRSGATMIQELRDMANSSTPQHLQDLTGAGQYVLVQVPITEVEIYQKGEENPELAAEVKMTVLDFS